MERKEALLEEKQEEIEGAREEAVNKMGVYRD